MVIGIFPMASIVLIFNDIFLSEIDSLVWHTLCMIPDATASQDVNPQTIREKGKMDRHLSQTVFNVEPLKNIVGVGDIMAYQIVVSHGAALGTVGTVSVPAYADVCNDPVFASPQSDGAVARHPLSWIRRTFAALKP